ncbi:MAG: hypothetical protein JO166_05720 [Deltaproteobacteria bacterium]|nr:hypothetical protein [Deltaproteobacteria bacterium]
MIELRLRRFAEEKSLPPAHVQKWLALDEPGRTRLLEIAETLKMRAGQCVATLALLEEVSIREGQTIAEILELPTLRRILNSPGSGPGRARLVLDELRALRYPQLHRAVKYLAEQVAALNLPSTIKIVLPRDLASDQVRVEIVAQGKAEMEEALGYLTAKNLDLVRLAEMVAGLDAGPLDLE